ncbi:unnamed protein product [Hapterophycus canaliculatus]
MEKLMTDIAISSGDKASATPATNEPPRARDSAAVLGKVEAAGAGAGRVTKAGVPVVSEGPSGASGNARDKRIEAPPGTEKAAAMTSKLVMFDDRDGGGL